MSDALPTPESAEPLPKTGRLAGIDYGTVRIGVAICDPGQQFASPLEVYTRRNERLDRQYFTELAQQERLAGWVVGLPVHLSGQESEESVEAIEFGQWLQQETKLPVNWIDERYTTSMAREILNRSTMSGKKRKAQLDKLAAQILLAAYLERDRNGRSGADEI
jgi:putative Holliday junction resolvase